MAPAADLSRNVHHYLWFYDFQMALTTTIRKSHLIAPPAALRPKILLGINVFIAEPSIAFTILKEL
ncbi:MAG: hypothetical protein JW932_12610 [Deltaproteobacteria bacterium]|nr:hypothetical protein [Deltaproteobacteria bacterium]